MRPSTPTPPIDRPDLAPSPWRPPDAPLHVLAAIARDAFCPAVVSVARALAEQRGAIPELTHVIELPTYSLLDGGIGIAVMTEELLRPEALQHTEGDLRRVCGAYSGIAGQWPFHIHAGDASTLLVQDALDTHADMIVMGLSHHGRVERAIGNDTVRALMAAGQAPVLAVRAGLASLPKSVIVAVDFSRASMRAARLARHIVSDTGTIYLVFVAPPHPDLVSESDEGRRLIEENGIETAFAQFIEALAPTPELNIVSMRRTGDPITELRLTCEAIRPQLIAIGSQRHSWLERVMLGSVATAMVNDGRWSVLVTPPAMAPSPAAAQASPPTGDIAA